MNAYNLSLNIISILKDNNILSRYSIFPMFDTNIDEKPNRSTFISVGIKNYYISEKIVSDDQNLNGKRKYTVEVKINFYSRYSYGAEYCYKLFDIAASQLLNSSSIKNKILDYKCSDAVYRRDIDSIVIKSVLKFEDIYT